MDLFSNQELPQEILPLSARFCPSSLEEIVGQEHLTAPGKILDRSLASDQLFSAIFFGPPGCGKTALARIFAKKSQAVFSEINAASATVDDLRQAIATAKERLAYKQVRTILFVDEIHHFNRRQQDALLPDVERGIITLIGNTTENPYFSIIAPLLSRVQLFEFKPLSSSALISIMQRSLNNQEQGLGDKQVNCSAEALQHLATLAAGDARRALNSLEIGVCSTPADKNGVIQFDLSAAEESIQKKMIRYDRSGDEHFNVISAFIKSMRGSAPSATLYWLAKMINAGEDPRFIARRIAICAAEDVGNADPQALTVAAAAFDLTEKIGLPEARIILAQAALYIATANKSNSVIIGIDKALADVKNGEDLEVPAHLKDTHRPFADKSYKYPHDFADNFVNQDYLPEHKSYYHPSNNGFEKQIKKRLTDLWLRKKDQRKNED